MTSDKPIPDDIMREAVSVFWDIAAKAQVRDPYGVQCWSAELGRNLIARAILAERAADKWQPIETAPRDGTAILAFGSYVYDGDDHPTIYMSVAEYCDGDPLWPWKDGEGLHRDTFFSHWMPLPQPPAIRGGS